MIKITIIIVLKSKLEVDSRQSSSHGLRSGSHKNKSDSYHIFKIQIGVRIKAKLGSWVGWDWKLVIIIVSKLNLKVDRGKAQVTYQEGQPRIDLSQYKNKSSYYHMFKTQFKSCPETRFKSRVKRVNMVNPNLFNK